MKKSEISVECAIPCLTCGYCRDGCAVSRYYGFEPFLVSFTRMFMASQIKYKSLILSDDLLNNLYMCTTCGYCKVCPYNVDLPSLIEKFRYNLKAQGLKVPRAFEVVTSAIKTEGNPYGKPKKERNKWLGELDFSIPNKSETMFFAGCLASYETQKIAISAAKILHHSHVKFGVLEEEPCCGWILKRTGFWEEAKEQAKKNINMLKGAKEVVTSCPACYRTFKKDYPETVGKLPFKVSHITEYIASLIRNKRLELGEMNLKVTYHDPCELSRYCGVYDAPREVLKAIHGLVLVEMYPTKHISWCCGAGGGVRTAFPGLAIEMAIDKIKLALETGAEAIVTACPLCLINLKDATKKANANLEIYDITEIIAKSMAIE